MGLSILIALVLLPTIAPFTGEITDEIFPYVLLVFKELSVGLIIGFAIVVVLDAILIAGQMIDMQMGFGVVNVINPLLEIQIPVTGQIEYLIAIVLFLVLNGHHILLRTLVESYNILPLSLVGYSKALTGGMIELSNYMWIIAAKIAAPVVGVLFLTYVSLGIVARTFPQMHVFIVGFPLLISLGLLLVALSLPFFGYLIKGMFIDEVFRYILGLLKMMKQGV